MNYSTPDVLTICTGLAKAGLVRQATDIQKYTVAAEMVLLGISHTTPDYIPAAYAIKEIEAYGFLIEAAALGKYMVKLQDRLTGYQDEDTRDLPAISGDEVA